MVVLKKIHRLSKNVEEYMNITEEVHRIVEESGVKKRPCSSAYSTYDNGNHGK